MKYKNIVYSKDKPDVLLDKISQRLESWNDMRMYSDKISHKYEGYIRDNKFVVRVIVRGRDSFNRVIKGIVEDNNEGILIIIKANFHIAVRIFFIYINAMIFMAAIYLTYFSIIEHKILPEMVILYSISLFLTLLGYFLKKVVNGKINIDDLIN